jgi:hypothetical protein
MTEYGEFRVVAEKSDFAQEFIYAPEYSMNEGEATHVQSALFLALHQQTVIQYRRDYNEEWRNW